MSSVNKKLNTKCVSCKVLLNDENMVKKEKKEINVLITLGIKKQLVDMYMEAIL